MSDKSITVAISKLGKLLKKLKLSIVTAESCTGGGLAYFISKNKDSSSLLERGYITYSNQSKEQILHVKPESLQLHGAVSKDVAIEMAVGALNNSEGQLSVAITGLAGEDKENKKESGVAWICFATHNHKIHVFKVEIAGSRNVFIKKIIQLTIKELLIFLKKLS